MRATQILLKRSSLRRLPLTTKQGPHNYYKGNRTGSMGRHTKHGGYIIDFGKVRTYVCPDLSDFHLTPYVPKQIDKPSEQHSAFAHTETKNPMDGKEYLRKWKEHGGRS